MKKEKILHVIPRIVQGGAEKLLLEICNFQPSNFNHKILVLMNNNDQEFLKNYDVDIEFLDFKSNLKLLMKLNFIKNKIEKLSPACVVFWLYHSAVLSFFTPLKNCKKFAYIHNTSLSKQAKPLERISQRMLATSLFRQDLNILFCGNASKHFHCEILGYSTENTFVLDNGIDLDRFSPNFESRAYYRASNNIEKKKFVFGCFGRFNPQKNWPLVLKTIKLAIKENKNVILLAAGRGVSKNNDEFVKLLEEYEVEQHVIAVGVQHEMQILYDAIDVLLLGSEYGEAFPLVIVEAMAMQKPTIAYDIGSTAAILEGLITPIALADENEFIGTAIKAANGQWHALSTCVGQKLRDRAIENYGIDKYCHNFEMIIDKNN